MEEVKRPQHYQIAGVGDSLAILVKIVEHNTDNIEDGILLFNTLKYLFRFGKKNGMQDLRKAQNYLSMLIAKGEANGTE